MANEAESRRNRAQYRRHFMDGYYGTRSRSHTVRQGSGARRGAEESPYSTRRKRIGEGE